MTSRTEPSSFRLRGPWSHPEVLGFLEQARIPLRLAAVAPSGDPFLTSLWFLVEDGALYCATSAEARLVRRLRERPRCAFEVAVNDMPYRGVRGRADVTLEPSRGRVILDRLLDRYLEGREGELGRALRAPDRDEVALRLSIRELESWDYSARMKGCGKKA